MLIRLLLSDRKKKIQRLEAKRQLCKHVLQAEKELARHQLESSASSTLLPGFLIGSVAALALRNREATLAAAGQLPWKDIWSVLKKQLLVEI